MNLKWSCVILSVVVGINALSQTDIDAFIDLAGLGYEDACYHVAESRWNFIKNLTNVTRDKLASTHQKKVGRALTQLQFVKIVVCDAHPPFFDNALQHYAEYKRTQKNEIIALTNETLEDTTLKYRYNLIKKPGDALLNVEEWKKFISFANDAESTIDYGNCSKVNVTADEKLKKWISYYKNLAPLTQNFSQSLKLVEKAATENGMNNVEEYWAMLSSYKEGYEDIIEKWNEIAPLHKRITKYLRKRLEQKYKYLMKNEKLPAHLLEIIHDYDWAQLSLNVVPYPNVTFEIIQNLLRNDLVGKNLYKSAAQLGNTIFKQMPQVSFWNNSEFMGQCPSRLINYCNGDVRLSTCSDPSIKNYLSAHKDVAEILVNQMSTGSSPILNLANRYSGINSGISEMFGILSMSRAWLLSQKLIKETDDVDEIQVISLMITALDILPRMAYYVTADTWRLDAIKNKTFETDELTSLWWKYRSQYEDISTESTQIPTFLQDDYIINNKPYLSKFLGILLGFQFYEYLMDSTEMRYDKLESINSKHELIKLIQNGLSNNWYDNVREHLDFYEVSTNALLSYFTPLEQYLDENEEELTIPIPLDLELRLERMQYEYRKKNENPPSTPMSTLPTVSTTPRPKLIIQQLEIPSSNSQISNKDNNFKNQSQITKIDLIKPQTNSIPIEKKDIADKKNNENVTETATSKAVWAVGAVLIATVTIVAIAIFGRKRCRKTPKNRRYV